MSTVTTPQAPPVPPTPKHTHRGRHRAIALAIIAGCYLMIALDSTVVNVALTHIGADLHFTPTGLAWVVNAYTLTFGGLLLLGGRMGDILGRRRVFVVGVVLFTAASILGGFAPNAELLVAARAVQGIGGALIAPSTMALIMNNFGAGPERTRALAIYSITAQAGASLGLVVGGLLTDLASWRWVLFINVPIGVAIVLAAPIFVAEPERHRGRLDLGGALTGTLGVSALVFGFIRAASDGWSDEWTLGAFAAAFVALGLFLVIESRVAQPLMPLRLLADRRRAAAFTTVLLLPATMFGIFFFITQFLQQAHDYSPVEAGVAFLPMTLALIAATRLAASLLPRLGTKTLVIMGTALLATTALWLTRLTADSGYATAILVPLVLAGLGVGFCVVPLNLSILSSVAPTEAGAASGLLQTFQWTGASLGLSILVTVFGAVRRAAEPGTSAPDVMADAMSSAFFVSAGFALLALLVAVFAVRGPKATR